MVRIIGFARKGDYRQSKEGCEMSQSNSKQHLNSLLIEREMCIAKIIYTNQRLEQLDAQIAEQRAKVNSEELEKAA